MTVKRFRGKQLSAILFWILTTFYVAHSDAVELLRPLPSESTTEQLSDQAGLKHKGEHDEDPVLYVDNPEVAKRIPKETIDLSPNAQIEECNSNPFYLKKSVAAAQKHANTLPKSYASYTYITNAKYVGLRKCSLDITVYFDEGGYLRRVANILSFFSNKKLERIELLDLDGNYVVCEDCILNLKEKK